jgi:hypothetical protein
MKKKGKEKQKGRGNDGIYSKERLADGLCCIGSIAPLFVPLRGDFGEEAERLGSETCGMCLISPGGDSNWRCDQFPNTEACSNWVVNESICFRGQLKQCFMLRWIPRSTGTACGISFFSDRKVLQCACSV